MMRHENWQSRLSALIESRRHTPREYGTLDCLLWAFEAIEAVYDLDFSQPYRGKYKTAKGGLKTLRKVGKVDTPQAALEKVLGERKPIAFAMIGDIVFADPDDLYLEVEPGAKIFGLVPGVCYGLTSAFVGETGLVFVETLKLRHSYYGLHI